MSKWSVGDAKGPKKRISSNPKYQHVKSKVDTGLSLTKYMERLEEIRRNYRYKKDEVFKRLKVSTFAQMVLQVASVSDLNENITENVSRPKDVSKSASGDRLPEHTDGSAHSSPQLVTLADGKEPSDMAFSPRSTLQSVISGVGELDLDKEVVRSVTPPPPSVPCAAQRPYPDCPYLLLDVRDRELYEQCHIISAHSYPYTMLLRTMNPYTKEVLSYRNVQGKIIILYDEDERIASQAATTMCRRGFENLFMLSGGLKVIAQKFPEGMTTGSFPTTCLMSLTGHLRRKLAALHRTPQPAENKWRFTSEDLNKVQHYLEEVLIPSSETSSRLSSRMSTSSSNTKVSSALNSRHNSGSAQSHSRRPWR
ncbi:centrosomal protein of 41 kDa-like [Clarias gariepinus]